MGLAGCNTIPTFEAGVGGDNEGCGLEGTKSVIVGDNSCACEPGYVWCSDEPDEFECCAEPETGGETGTDNDNLPPDAP